jgi:hypothetical protein
MTSKFKAGDTVVCVTSKFSFVKEGCVYEVTNGDVGESGSGSYIHLDVGSGNIKIYSASNFKLFNPNVKKPFTISTSKLRTGFKTLSSNENWIKTSVNDDGNEFLAVSLDNVTKCNLDNVIKELETIREELFGDD